MSKFSFKISILTAIKVVSPTDENISQPKFSHSEGEKSRILSFAKARFPPKTERYRQSFASTKPARSARECVCVWANKYLHRILGIRLEACDVERLHVPADHVKPHGLVQQILALNIFAFKLEWGCSGEFSFSLSPRLWFPARARGSPWWGRCAPCPAAAASPPARWWNWWLWRARLAGRRALKECLS